MSAFQFLAGLGGAYTAIDAGMRAARERQQADEDREFLKSQRGLMQQQQQRQIDEQKRADRLREDLAAIPFVERVDVDFNKANPETSKITIDNEGGPSATQLPAVRPVSRPRTRDAQLRDAAGAYRRSGDLGRAFELEGAADKEMFDRAARQFAQLKAGSANMTAAQIARQAQSIFDNDPFPMQVAAIREGADGSVAVDIRNRDTGAMQTWNAKNKNDLLSGIEAYYSPESYQALQRARAEAAAKAEGERLTELYKPYTLKPGERREAVDPSTGKTMLLGVGEVPPDRELVVDGNGNLLLRRTDGQGTQRAGAKVESPQDRAAEAFDTVLKNSTLKEGTPDQVSRGRTLARQFATQGNVDPAVAADAAVLAITKPDAIRTTFDDKTGKIVDAIEYKGGNFIVEDRGGVESPRGLKPETLTSIANEYVSTKIPQQDRSLFIAAAYSGEARAALDARTRQAVREVLQARLGRAPKEEEFAPAAKAAVDATAPILNLIGNHLRPEAKRLGEMLSGSGFALVGGKVVRASAPQATPPGAAAAVPQVGSAIPADAAARAGQAAAERKRKEDEAAAERQRVEREAREKRSRDEEAVRGLTVEIARAMTPDQAREIYTKYSQLIRDARIREALQMRMSGRQRDALPAAADSRAPASLPARTDAAPASSSQAGGSLQRGAQAAAPVVSGAAAAPSSGERSPALAPSPGLGITPPASAAKQPAPLAAAGAATGGGNQPATSQAQPQDAQASAAPLRASFDNASVRSVAKAMTILTGVPIVVDPALEGQKISFASEGDESPQEALKRFKDAARKAGFTVNEGMSTVYITRRSSPTR